jgi:hypothetical protein
VAQAVAGQTNALAGKARSRVLRDDDDDEEGIGPADLDKSRNELINTGPNAVQLSVKLLEEKLVEYQAMKAKPKTSELEKGVTAANATAAANEILNEWQEERTGGKRTEDESRYRVTIKRLMANGAAEWSGEVTGPPAFYPMKTVDVLVAGKTVQVLDKSNKKLWENKLNYPVSQDSPLERDFWNEEEFSKFSPCAEQSNALYLFDQGVLTAFELASGNVRWRLPSVGISKVQFDDKGMMYVTSTSAGADNLK